MASLPFKAGLARTTAIIAVVASSTAPFLAREAHATGAHADVTDDVADAPPGNQFPEPAASGNIAAGSPFPAFCDDGLDSGDYVWEVPGWGRTYRIHIPATSRGIAAPLVLNFHGSGRTAVEQEAYSGLLPLADRDGYIVVSPEGSGSPSGWDIPGVYHEIGVDDVAFVSDLVAEVTATVCVDRLRMYATGLSNGAQMASQVACSLPDLFAAVAPVSGVQYPSCDADPVPLLAFHGTADMNIPYGWPASAAAEWALHNGCADSQDESITDHVTARFYTGCDADVVFYTIIDGGHTWPGAEDDTGGVGFTTHEISASEIIWQFFAAHTKI